MFGISVENVMISAAHEAIQKLREKQEVRSGQGHNILNQD